ncbi:DUF6497 family protein [Neogemmobacter tilapiae]|uniref:Acetolactate synthase n=1 Tax=Neogemmobacter tilapiae TaxID=875041 RepID=A0A918TIT2_9RHOB|nr:DUF6497 family protein [Gemmobacter tilapiae]GHC49564.1 hypothetical protein GCM10007315_09690 [Gemmobacter tilapiae]
MEEVTELLTTPSGLIVSLIEVVNDAPGPEGLTTRFRFLAPDLAGVDFDLAAADMLHLCQSYALSQLPKIGPEASQIIISLSDRLVPFGEAAPEALQYFEAYRIENGECVWEMY